MGPAIPNSWDDFQRSLDSGVNPDAETQYFTVTGPHLKWWQKFYMNVSGEHFDDASGKMVPDNEMEARWAREVRAWNEARGFGAEQLELEQRIYWQRLRRSHGPRGLTAKVTSHPQWRSFRDAHGANPALYAIRVNPMMVDMDPQSPLGQAQSQVDGQGRDRWFYMLSSTATHQKQAIGKLAKAYPPQLDKNGQGWLGLVMDCPINWMRPLSTHGLKILNKRMFRDPKWGFQAMLEPGTREQQRAIVQRALQTPGHSQADFARVLYTFYRAMGYNVRQQLIPELEMLMILGHPGMGMRERDPQGYEQWQMEAEAVTKRGIDFATMAEEGEALSREMMRQAGESDPEAVSWLVARISWDNLHRMVPEQEAGQGRPAIRL